MIGSDSKQKNKFLDTLKWYTAGALATVPVYSGMRYFNADMSTIVAVFQGSSGVLLGALLQTRAWSADKKQQ